MKTTVFLVRHAQSVKNIRDVHGGIGERLTEYGVLQADRLADNLLTIGIDSANSVLVYPPVLQAVETASILKARIGLHQLVIDEFRPLDLGIIAGLSNREVKKQFPEYFQIMRRWRNREIEICDLTIPGMESPHGFFTRGQILLTKIQHNKNNIFVCTNSLYILLLNIIFGNSPERGGGYKHFNVQNCGLTLFEKDDIDHCFRLNRLVTDVDDVNNYPII